MPFKSSGKPYARSSPSGGIPEGQWLHDKHNGAEKARNVPRGAESTIHAPSSAKLLIDNLHYDVSEKDLASLFGKYGPFAKDPRIRFDKSGRSTGAATVVFEQMEDAAAAKKALDKQLAKGQEISVCFDTAPANARGGASRGGAASLLARLDGPIKASLPNRMGDTADSVASSNVDSGGVGPHRTRAGRGGSGRESGRERKPPRKPLTAEDLDKDLEQYSLEAEEGPVAVQAGPASVPAVTSTLDEDVEMA